MASAKISPIFLSPFAEIVPTWATSTFEDIFFAFDFTNSTTCSVAMSMPRFKSIGFIPASTALSPSFAMARAKTVAVVVPSPALSLVFDATSLIIETPKFIALSLNSISLATDTPSFVILGEP